VVDRETQLVSLINIYVHGLRFVVAVACGNVLIVHGHARTSLSIKGTEPRSPLIAPPQESSEDAWLKSEKEILKKPEFIITFVLAK
jgi:hypothetical protein